MTSLTGAIWSAGREDHPLRPGDRRGTVPGQDAEGVSCLEHLRVVGEGERDASPDDVPPVLARAQVVGQTPQERGHVRLLPEVQDGDLVAVHDLLVDVVPRRCPSSRRVAFDTLVISVSFAGAGWTSSVGQERCPPHEAFAPSSKPQERTRPEAGGGAIKYWGE